MIIHTMKSTLPGATAASFYDFMINAPQEIYRRWLPEEHHQFHIVERSKESPIGDLVFFDQHISPKHRLTFHAKIKAAKMPNYVLFQMRKIGINLPGYLQLEFNDTTDGLALTETISIGFNGLGKVFSPIIGLVFNETFFKELNGHHKREWECLAEILT